MGGGQQPQGRPPTRWSAARARTTRRPSSSKVSIKGVGEAEAEGLAKQEAETEAAQALLEQAAMSKRFGTVAVVGAPNAGKSTLVNALVGQKVAIVTPKAQTTRTRLMGIAILGEAQILLTDTPGIFEPKRRLDRAMVAAAWGSAQDADLIALVVDAGDRPQARRRRHARPAEGPARAQAADPQQGRSGEEGGLARPDRPVRRARRVRGHLHDLRRPPATASPELKAALAARMPEGPWHFPEDQVSDATDRMMAAEITREQLYLQLHAELPYASAIETEKYEERKDGSVAIHQQILVGRDSQKAIVLGKGGARIKEIGAAARAELADALGRKVHLFLHVKVNPKWEEDRGLYREIGLDWVE